MVIRKTSVYLYCESPRKQEVPANPLEFSSWNHGKYGCAPFIFRLSSNRISRVGRDPTGSTESDPMPERIVQRILELLGAVLIPWGACSVPHDPLWKNLSVISNLNVSWHSSSCSLGCRPWSRRADMELPLGRSCRLRSAHVSLSVLL